MTTNTTRIARNTVSRFFLSRQIKGKYYQCVCVSLSNSRDAEKGGEMCAGSGWPVTQETLPEAGADTRAEVPFSKLGKKRL